MQMRFILGLGTLQMAVFLVNSCKFNGCGLTFATLSELIQHIEDFHIDSDPQLLEQQESKQPPSLALSYVFRVFTDVSHKEKRPRLSSLSPVSSLRSATPTGSEFDEEERCSSDNDSDDSWTTQEEFTSELILSMMANANRDPNSDKPFACPVPGCKKRYKNINGIKYHAKHGHKKEIRVKKIHKCKCGKSYKSLTALQSHTLLQHQGAAPTSLLMVKPKAASKPKKTSVPKNKNSGIVGKLPVAALASQAQVNKQIRASLKHMSTNLQQAVLTATSNGQPTTALVTVPVTFGKLPTSNAQDMKVISGFPHQQQQMLNLIAPTGLVPPGTTITVPMEQIARNLALLQQVTKSTSALFTTTNNTQNAFSILATPQGGLYKDSIVGPTLTSRLTQNAPDLAVPNCMLSEDAISPYTFSESGFEDSRDEEIDEIEVCADKSNDECDIILELDSPLSSQEQHPMSILTGSHIDSLSGSTIDHADLDKKFVTEMKNAGGISSGLDMEISV